MSFFTWQGRKQTVQGECFLNERQPNSPEHEDRSGWQRRKIRLQWLMWLIRISEQTHFFTRRAVDVVSEACFTAMTGDRHDERAAMNFSMIIFALTPSWLVWILTVMPVWLYFGHHFCFVLFCFWTLNFVYYTSVSCVWFLLPYVSLKIFKTRNAYFVFSFEDFRICSRFNNVNYGAWYVCKPLFGSSVATYRLACFEISLSIIEKKLKRSSGKGRT